MQGERVWNSIEWGPPLKLDETWRSTRELKPKHELSKLENEVSEANTQVLYYILNGVSLDGFHGIIM